MAPPPRKRSRLAGYVYSSPGTYFITINAHEHGPWFGTIVNGLLLPNAAGSMILNIWNGLPERYPGIIAGDVIVMPDHLHGIIMLGTDPEIPAVHNLSAIMQAFKSITTVEYGRGVKTKGWREYNRHLWHRGFNDIIAESDRAFKNLQDYIQANPSMWAEKYGR